MALDEALLNRARTSGEAVLRVYGWSEPTLSFGRNQTARGRYDLLRIQSRGLGVVRRLTGGRTILHNREVTYSVTAPAERMGSLRESYERINRLLVYGLERLGVRASVEGRDRQAPRPTEAPCFEVPVAGELIVDGRKLAGSAQWREGGALLQHGSILVEDDQSTVTELLVRATAGPPPPATLREALGWTPGPEHLATELFEAVRALEHARADPLMIDATLTTVATRARARYVDDLWTWRR